MLSFLLVALVSVCPQVLWAQAGIPYLAEPASPPINPPPKPAEAAPVEVVPPPEVVAAATRGIPWSGLEALWEERRLAVVKGDKRGASDTLDKLLLAKRDAGWPNIFIYGEALAYESSVARQNGDNSYAVSLASAATEMAPVLVATWAELARAHWQDGDLLWAGQAALKSVWAGWHNADSRHLWLGSLSMAGLAAMLFAAVWVACVVVYRHGRMLAHNVSHVLPRFAARWQVALLTACLLALPIVGHLGLAWTLLYVLLLLSPYVGWRERIACVLVVFSLAVSVAVLPRLLSQVGWPQSEQARAYHAFTDAAAEEDAAALKAQSDHSFDELYILALRENWSGNTVSAGDYLEQAERIRSDPNLAVLLGNLRYLAGKFDQAIGQYEKALRMDPANLAALVNLSQVYYARTDNQMAGDYHRKAMAIDYEAVEHYSREAKRVGRWYVVEPPPPAALLNDALQTDRQADAAGQQLWSYLSSRGSRWTFVATALAIALMIGLLGALREPLRPAQACVRCGGPVCRRCNPELTTFEQCGPCFHSFVEHNHVDPQTRIQKELEALRYKARRTRVRQGLTFLWAGAGQLARGSALLGWLWATCFGFVLILAAVAFSLAPEPIPMPHGLRDLTGYGLVVVAIVLYVAAVVDGLREEGL